MFSSFAVDNDEVAMTTRLNGDKTRFLPYNKDIKNPINPNGYKVDYLWSEILAPRSLLDIVENFVHIGEEIDLEYDVNLDEVVEKKSEVLIFPRYHQLQLIRKLKRTVRRGNRAKIFNPAHYWFRKILFYWLVVTFIGLVI